MIFVIKFRFQYSYTFYVNIEVRVGLLEVIKRIYSDQLIKTKIDQPIRLWVHSNIRWFVDAQDKKLPDK